MVLPFGESYEDPFNDVELDVVVTDPEGREQRVPAFWGGGQVWRVRYAPHVAGRYEFRSVSSDSSNSDLHGRTGTLEVSEYKGENPCCGTARCASPRTGATSSTPTAPPSFGWAIPGGWDSVTG